MQMLEESLSTSVQITESRGALAESLDAGRNGPVDAAVRRAAA